MVIKLVCVFEKITNLKTSILSSCHSQVGTNMLQSRQKPNSPTRAGAGYSSKRLVAKKTGGLLCTQAVLLSPILQASLCHLPTRRRKVARSRVCVLFSGCTCKG